MDSFIPFHRPSIGREETEEVLKVLASGWLTTGAIAQRFEREFAAYIGCKYALAVNSATAALQLGLDAIGLRPGDEVLVPTYTFTASAEVVTYFGARPVLCDSAPGGFNIDPEDVKRKVTSRTRAIMPVHIAGQACELNSLHRIAKHFGLRVIEDAAHALPAWYRGSRIGTTSELTAFSFYATKTITTGEGGMLTTDNPEYAERAAIMRLHGISGDAWKRYSKEGSWYYEVVDAGYKLNLPDVLAALGVAQLAKCDRFWRRRSEIAALYRQRLAEFKELELPPGCDDPDQHAWHLLMIRICHDALELTRNGFIDELKRSGIGTSVHFIPLHLHPFYQKCFGYKAGDFPNAEDAYSRSISLPLFPDMTEGDVNRVLNAIEKIICAHRKRILAPQHSFHPRRKASYRHDPPASQADEPNANHDNIRRTLMRPIEIKLSSQTARQRSRHLDDYLQLIGVQPLPPATSPFDPGYDPLTLEGHLQQSAHLMSILKISMACWMIADEAATRAKLAAARRHRVPTVTGGGPFEIAVAQGQLPAYLDLCADIGVTRIECGEGFTDMPLPPTEVVRMAEERGLEVQFELGKKHSGAFSEAAVAQLIEQGRQWLGAGALQLVVEARESARGVGLFDDEGNFNAGLADRFAAAFGLDVVLFEAPNKPSQFRLLDHFGSAVHLCNVRIEELLRVEIYRRGLHSDAFSNPKLRPTVVDASLQKAG